MKTTLFAVAALSIASTARGSEQMHAGAREVALARLANTGRVLYVAAHPDDENTRLLAYLANARHYDVAYLSLTRGGGGQNLIGSEQASMLGVIRTQELLAARRIDGAQQRFTRALDFGYSKTAAETVETWGHDAILADVVWVIRSFQPDVVITRFTEQPPNHGHHTASAILAREAFEAAADPKRFPEQLTRGVKPWKPTRVMQNVPRWGRSDDEDLSAYLALDVGGYDPRLGQSYGEIAGASRSMHKSQGFGSAGARGPILEYFETIAGSAPKKDLFDGIDTSWRRVRGAQTVRTALAGAATAHDSERPEAAVKPLLAAYRALDRLARTAPEPRVVDAREKTAEAIAMCAGLFARVTADRPEAAPKQSVALDLEVVLRRSVPLKIEAVDWGDGPAKPATNLEVHAPRSLKHNLAIPADAAVSAPYWLAATPEVGRYRVTDPKLIGEAEGPHARTVRIDLKSGATTFTLERPVEYAWTDRVLGERTRRFVVLPPATVTPLASHAMFPNGEAREVRVAVRAAKDDVEALVELGAAAPWTVKPARHTVKLARAGAEQVVTFTVKGPADGAPVTVRPTVTVDGAKSGWRYDLVDHPHIPVQAVLRPSELELVPLALASPKVKVGYLAGSGDTVAQSLASVGIDVEDIDADTLRRGDLARYDVIVIGVRAFNVRTDLVAAHPALMRWVENGGALIAQYNTSNRWAVLTDPVGPFPFEIDRDRVTDERAAVAIIDPKHPLFTSPNRITVQDFDGWVQERGLYFASKWDPRYVPLMRMHDEGEPPLEGALLVAKHGRGTFVYTGISFFRQLPAGVPGAYRLFVNLLALGKP